MCQDFFFITLQFGEQLYTEKGDIKCERRRRTKISISYIAELDVTVYVTEVSVPNLFCLLEVEHCRVSVSSEVVKPSH